MTLSGFGKYGKRHYLILENWWSLERAFRQQGHFKEFSSLEKCYSPTFIKLATLAPLCLGISRESWAEFGIQREQGRNFKLFIGLCLLVIHDLGKPETVPQSGWQSQYLKALKKKMFWINRVMYFLILFEQRLLVLYTNPLRCQGESSGECHGLSNLVVKA